MIIWLWIVMWCGKMEVVKKNINMTPFSFFHIWITKGKGEKYSLHIYR